MEDRKTCQKKEVSRGKQGTQKNSFCEIKIKKGKCKGCKLCIFYCPTKHLELSSDLNKRGVTYAKIKEASTCIGCGFCFLICPDNCIEVYIDQKPKTKDYREE